MFNNKTKVLLKYYQYITIIATNLNNKEVV